MENLIEGQWYLLDYGFENPIGKCIAILPNGALMRFRWGTPFRVKIYVKNCEILGRVRDLRVIAQIIRLFIRKPIPEPEEEKP